MEVNNVDFRVSPVYEELQNSKKLNSDTQNEENKEPPPEAENTESNQKIDILA